MDTPKFTYKIRDVIEGIYCNVTSENCRSKEIGYRLIVCMDYQATQLKMEMDDTLRHRFYSQGETNGCKWVIWEIEVNSDPLRLFVYDFPEHKESFSDPRHDYSEITSSYFVDSPEPNLAWVQNEGLMLSNVQKEIEIYSHLATGSRQKVRV